MHESNGRKEKCIDEIQKTVINLGRVDFRRKEGKMHR